MYERAFGDKDGFLFSLCALYAIHKLFALTAFRRSLARPLHVISRRIEFFHQSYHSPVFGV